MTAEFSSKNSYIHGWERGCWSTLKVVVGAICFTCSFSLEIDDDDDNYERNGLPFSIFNIIFSVLLLEGAPIFFSSGSYISNYILCFDTPPIYALSFLLEDKV